MVSYQKRSIIQLPGGESCQKLGMCGLKVLVFVCDIFRNRETPMKALVRTVKKMICWSENNRDCHNDRALWMTEKEAVCWHQKAIEIAVTMEEALKKNCKTGPLVPSLHRKHREIQLPDGELSEKRSVIQLPDGELSEQRDPAAGWWVIRTERSSCRMVSYQNREIQLPDGELSEQRDPAAWWSVISIERTRCLMVTYQHREIQLPDSELSK